MSRVALLLGLLAAATSQAEECRLSLDAVLTAYSEARGGAETARAQTALRTSADYREDDLRATFDFRVMKPAYMRIKATFADGGTFEEGFDGRRAWEKHGNEAAKYIDGDAAQALRQSAQSPLQLYGLTDMEDLDAAVTLQGCKWVEGTNYYVVNVQSSFGTDIDYYVAADTFRLERSRTSRPLHPSQDPTPIVIEERWDDFRWVDGLLRPFANSTWNLDTRQRLSSLTIRSISLDDEASTATFAKP